MAIFAVSDDDVSLKSMDEGDYQQSLSLWYILLHRLIFMLIQLVFSNEWLFMRIGLNAFILVLLN